MAEIQASAIAGVVLAGGASSRMGESKALMPFLGETLVARALARLRPQVGDLYLNARADAADWTRFGAPLVFDAADGRGAGPLAGVVASLRRAAADGFSHLATVPCDAPFAPRDLVARLAAAGVDAALAVSSRGLEPMFALWPVAALPRLEIALADGASPRAALLALGAAEAAFAADAVCDPFANLNTPQEFTAAERLARVQSGRKAL